MSFRTALVWPGTWSRKGKSEAMALRKKLVPDYTQCLFRGDQCHPPPPPDGEGLAPLKKTIGPSRVQGQSTPFPLVDLLVLQKVLLLDKALLTLWAAIGPLTRVDALVPH